MQQAEVAKKNYYPTSTGICQEFNNFKSVQRSIHLQGRQKKMEGEGEEARNLQIMERCMVKE